jgi:hypothetical protein
MVDRRKGRSGRGDSRTGFEPGERDRRRGHLLRLPRDLDPIHRLDAQKAVPVGGSDQPREAGGSGARGSSVLERQQHSLILRLLAGEHGGVLATADRDIAGSVGGAGKRKEGCKPRPDLPNRTESQRAVIY